MIRRLPSALAARVMVSRVAETFFESSDQGYFAVEIRLLLGVQFQGDTAGGGDAFQHCERMAGIFGIFQTGNHRLRRPNLLSELSLSEARILPHLTDEECQVNLVQGAREGLTVGSALACAPLDNFSVFVALAGLLHRPNSFRIASRSFCDPV